MNEKMEEWKSMSAARKSSKTALPSKYRDGFELIPANEIVYDVDKTLEFKFEDLKYEISSVDRCARFPLIDWKCYMHSVQRRYWN